MYMYGSLSARRAWIEIACEMRCFCVCVVALRKESVDRNGCWTVRSRLLRKSLSARRAWIEIETLSSVVSCPLSLSARRAWIEICGGACARRLALVALRKESVDRNAENPMIRVNKITVALRKESVDRNVFVYGA